MEGSIVQYDNRIFWNIRQQLLGQPGIKHVSVYVAVKQSDIQEFKIVYRSDRIYPASCVPVFTCQTFFPFPAVTLFPGGVYRKNTFV